MRQPALSALTLALGVSAAFALASCGSGEDANLLPGTTAREITENLDRVKQFANEGECVGAADAAQEVSAQVEALGGVDAKLKQALQRGTTRLDEVIATCDETTEAVEPEMPTVKEEEKVPPGQEKKEEKAKEKEKPPKESPPPHGPPATTPPEETPPSPPTETAPAEEGGGTGAPGGVSPNSAVGGE